MKKAFFALALFALPAAAQVSVGPEKGAVMVVGGGSLGLDVYSKFIELAGGPDALIIDVPTAGGAATYGRETASSRSLKAAGARNVVVLHTIDRVVADADSFVAPINKAGGVWFEGGRQWHLVDSYTGTKTETAFRNVIARGGVAGGTSAGASILSTFLLRGAREGNEIVVAPQYLVGFGYLRGVAIDQHVVARGRLRDLADSLVPRYPNLLGISEDEGTAWVVQGDRAEIIGRNKAFVYNGKQNDPGRPFLTLRPGDTYDLAKRQLIGRAIDGTALNEAFVDGQLATRAAGTHATIVVARAGKVLVNKGYGVPEDSAAPRQGAKYATYMPTTTVPQFDIGNIALPINSIIAQNYAFEGKLNLDATVIPGSADLPVRHYLLGHGTAEDARRFTDLGGKNGIPAYAMAVNQRIYGPIGMHQTVVANGSFRSDVDELYRFELGLEQSSMFLSDSARTKAGSTPLDLTLGWTADRMGNRARLSQSVLAGGKGGVFMRFPDDRTTIIILTNDSSFDAAKAASAIAERLLGK